MQQLRHMMALNGAYTRWGAATQAHDGVNGAYTRWGAATQAHDGAVWYIHEVGCSNSGT